MSTSPGVNVYHLVKKEQNSPYTATKNQSVSVCTLYMDFINF